MTNTEMTNQLEMRWVPVTDDDGRTHMEARWIDASARPRARHVTHAA